MVLMLTTVIPRLSDILLESGQNIPVYTRVVIGLGQFFSQYLWLLGIGLVIAIVVGIRYFQTDAGRAYLSRVQLSIPYVGDLYQKVFLARIADSLSTTLKSGIQLVLGLLAALLASCGQGSTPAATPTVAPPLVVACGTADFRDLKMDLMVAEIEVKADGSAPLYETTCVDQSKIVARIPGGTNLVPTEARALFAANPNGAALEAGMFYRVSFNGKEGWLFSEQLNFKLTTPQAAIPKPDLSANGAATATTAAQNSTLKCDIPPCYTSIGTPDVAVLNGAKYVYLYESPDFNSKVVALVPPKKGAIVLLVREAGQLVSKANAKYADDSWFLLIINHSQGWAHASSLAIN
jgi:hypothetical protein